MMENEQIIITALTDPSPEAQEAIKNLAQKIGNNYKELTAEDFSSMISSPGTTLLVAKIGETIVGMLTLLVYRIPYVKKAYLDDLAVDEAHRGKGIAKQLMSHAMSLAKEKGAAYIDLTARPRRAEGNNLYENLGFKKRETNVYRLAFDYGEI
jgi:ribosomal protein S18 acetylase RimI-like enzyme